ncbi:MAG: YfiR family protein [Myxococcota bacterium]
MSRLWLYLALLTAAPAGPAHAEPTAVEGRAVLLLTRALGYDRHLVKRVGERLTIGVLVDATAPQQERRAREIQSYLRTLESLSVRGVPVDCVVVPLEIDGLPLTERIQRLKLDVVLLVDPPGSWPLQQIFEATRSTETLSVSTDPNAVREGASLAAAPRGNRIQLFVNLRASRQEGASFSTELLQLAEVYR